MKIVIRFGGLIETFIQDNELTTCHLSEAMQFNSIEDAEKFYYILNYSGTKGASIRDAQTNAFIKWLNW